MSACGRGLTTPSAALLPEASAPDNARTVSAFLSQRQDSISCRELPADLHGDGLDGPQRASRYLLLTVAAAWTLTAHEAVPATVSHRVAR